MASREGFAVDASLIEADANRQRSVAAAEWKTTEATSRLVREYLAVLDENTWGAATDVQPKFISDSDPAAQWAAAKDGPAPFAYSDNYLTNLRSAVILFVEGSRSVRLAEGGAAKIMIERMAQRFDLKPEWQGFHYDKVADAYVCPGGKSLTTTGTPSQRRCHTSLPREFSRSRSVSAQGSLLPPTSPLGRSPRSLYEDARDLARSLADTPALEQSRRERKKVEMLFAHLKRILGLDRLRLRGP
jgi:hypothetical protein